MKWKSKRHTLYQEVNESGGIRLQVIYMTIGDCEAKLYQELIWNREGIESNEYTEIPLNWNRWIVINEALYFKTYYQVNKEKMNSYSKQWKKDNKEKWNKYQRERLKKLRSVQKEIVGRNPM